MFHHINTKISNSLFIQKLYEKKDAASVCCHSPLSLDNLDITQLLAAVYSLQQIHLSAL